MTTFPIPAPSTFRADRAPRAFATRPVPDENPAVIPHNRGPWRWWPRAAVYAAAWLPYLAVYVVVFLASGAVPGLALRGAVANVLPEAALGVFIVVMLALAVSRVRKRLD